MSLRPTRGQKAAIRRFLVKGITVDDVSVEQVEHFPRERPGTRLYHIQFIAEVRITPPPRRRKRR